MSRKIKLTTYVIILIATLAASLHLANQMAVAGSGPDFAVSDSYILVYEEGNNYVTVSEKLSIKAFNSSYKLPSGTTQQFLIHDFLMNSTAEERKFKRDSLRVVDSGGNKIPVQPVDADRGLSFSISTPYDITTDRDYFVTIEFNTHELVNINGNIINFYIPGIPEDTELRSVNRANGVKFAYEYDAQLSIPNSLPQASYISPQGVEVSTIGNSRVFKISTLGRMGETGWIQIGTEQYYYFKMVQKTPKTDTLIPPGVSNISNYLSTNIYQLPLPKTYSETDQEVFFSKLSPKPTRIETDSEGNIIGYFEVPANIDSSIEIEGYIKLKNSGTKEVPQVQLDHYYNILTENSSLLRYTQPDRYWESDSDVVKKIANQLSDGKTTLNELIKADYDYIVNTFDYSYEKVQSDNERLGAVAALNGADAVCMEYADALIAILRAQGIPAKAAIGYGNDPTGAENSIGADEASEQNIAHQWVLVWVPEYGWLSVDPTWGESKRVYIGGNLDHILWYTIGDSEQDYIGTALSSADSISSDSFENYSLFIQAVPAGELPDLTEMPQIDHLVQQYSNPEDSVSSYIKTTPLGKSIVIVAPVCFILLFTFLLASLFVRLLRKKRKI